MTTGKGKKPVAVLGYGSQGRAIACNLRDSGYPVLVGLRTRSASRRRVRADGLKATAMATAVRESSVVCMALPDHVHATVYRTHVAPNLRPGHTLWFLHGLSVHFGLVEPPDEVDVVLIAPHAPGPAVREQFLGERKLSAFVAVAQDASGRAVPTVRRLARAIGIRPRRMLETTFAEEAVGDLFGEQAVLCGGLAMLIKHGFETLVAHGHRPAHAYLELVYQLDLIVALVKQYGVQGMLERVSVAARTGSVQAGPKLLDQGVRRRMERLYRRIASGRFARELAALSAEERAAVDRRLRDLTHPALERAARRFGKD